MRARRRGWWKGPLLAVAAACWYAAANPGGGQSGAGSSAGPAQLRARVLEVTDGDTVRARLRDGTVESVRYIGVDTPETSPGAPVQCFGRRASRENERLVEGREVLLRFGPERRDAYGRLLAFVFAPPRERSGRPPAASSEALFVNAALVRGGFARTLTIAPNDVRAPQFGRLEAAAGRAGVGLWGACP